jgi:hypothetical protein
MPENESRDMVDQLSLAGKALSEVGPQKVVRNELSDFLPRYGQLSLAALDGLKLS